LDVAGCITVLSILGRGKHASVDWVRAGVIGINHV
jgi:hypothetical protein